MALKLSSLKSDRARTDAGDWIEIPDWPGVAVRVRGLSHPAYVYARDQVNRRLARKHKGDAAGPAEMRQRDDERLRLNGEILAEHVLLDWRGFDEEYSAERALAMLSDPAMELLIGNVTWAAAQVGQAKAEFSEEQEKN